LTNKENQAMTNSRPSDTTQHTDLTRVESTEPSESSYSPRLVVIQGPELGDQIVMGEQPLVLGRSSQADVQLSAPGVSRRHCRVERRNDGCWIEDLESTNKTRVNGDAIESAVLNDGDQVRLGQTVLKFIAATNPEAAYYEKLAEEATRDPRTGLFRRSFVVSSLEKAADQASANPEEPAGGVIYLALDGHSELRDRIGMAGIERLLGLIGQRLVSDFDKQHLPAIYGEHSLILMARDLDPEALLSLAEQMRQRVRSDLFEINSEELAVTVSLGVCPFNLRIGNADAMLVCAARAAEACQSDGGDQCRDYRPTVLADRANEDEQKLLGLLREAMTKGTMQTRFQPAVSMNGDEISHYQILPRLLTDDDELISAGVFIPIAERHDVILSIDRWMSIRALRAIEDQLENERKMRLFVNQSAKSLADATRYKTIANKQPEQVAEERLLVFEFRHADVSRNLKSARQLLPELRALGFGVAISGIDDASEAGLMLSHLQADYYRIASSLTREVGRDETATSRFDKMIERIHAANAKALVSQVEDAETMSRLWSRNVDLLQGNFIQQPSQKPDFSL
jgi:multidomain signaling protein FimX